MFCRVQQQIGIIVQKLRRCVITKQPLLKPWPIINRMRRRRCMHLVDNEPGCKGGDDAQYTDLGYAICNSACAKMRCQLPLSISYPTLPLEPCILLMYFSNSRIVLRACVRPSEQQQQPRRRCCLWRRRTRLQPTALGRQPARPPARAMATEKQRAKSMATGRRP